MLCPLGQFGRWRVVRESGQKYSGIDRAVRSFECTANCYHANHASIAHEAMFDESPLVVPAYQARLDLDGLKYFEIAAKLGDGIANHREGVLPPRNAERTGKREPVNPADVCYFGPAGGQGENACGITVYLCSP